MKDELIRLSKIMSERGMCSRREADRYIEAGQVVVEGEVISTLGTKVFPDAAIELLHSFMHRPDLTFDEVYPVLQSVITLGHTLEKPRLSGGDVAEEVVTSVASVLRTVNGMTYAGTKLNKLRLAELLGVSHTTIRNWMQR